MSPFPETIKALSQLPVAIDGEWDTGSQKWKGFARAAEPLVSVLFLTAGTDIDWCKSERGRLEGLEVSVTLYRHDEPGIFQVNAIAGMAGRRTATQIPPGSRPEIVPQQGTITGRAQDLAIVKGNPVVIVSLLYVAASDVEIGRKGLWRVRPALADQIDEPLRTILSRDRTGQMRAA